jgi:hypothetical protein
LGWETYAFTRLRSAWASLGEPQGRELGTRVRGQWKKQTR